MKPIKKLSTFKPNAAVLETNIAKNVVGTNEKLKNSIVQFIDKTAYKIAPGSIATVKGLLSKLEYDAQGFVDHKQPVVGKIAKFFDNANTYNIASILQNAITASNITNVNGINFVRESGDLMIGESYSWGDFKGKLKAVADGKVILETFDSSGIYDEIKISTDTFLMLEPTKIEEGLEIKTNGHALSNGDKLMSMSITGSFNKSPVVVGTIEKGGITMKFKGEYNFQWWTLKFAKLKNYYIENEQEIAGIIKNAFMGVVPKNYVIEMSN